MNNNEILANLRKRMVEAVQIGMVNQDAGGVLETVLIQIVNEAERNKQRCDQLSYDYKRQAAQAEAQANAYTQIQSIVYAVLNGFVNAAAVAVEQEKQREQTKEELSNEELEALAALAAQQEEEKEKEATKRRRR